MYRLLMVSPVAVLITLSLFWLMSYLITANRPDFKSQNKASTLDFIRLKHDEQELQTKKRPEPPKKETPQDMPPPVPVMQMAAPSLEPMEPMPQMAMPTIDVAPVNVRFTPMMNTIRPAPTKAPVRSVPVKRAPARSAPVQRTPARTAPAARPASQGAGSGLVALSRVEPRYPSRARLDGIEGWVKLRFTVTAQGRVKDVKVVSSKPRKIFDKAARKALKRWKFKAVIVNGKPVARSAEQVMQFKLN